MNDSPKSPSIVRVAIVGLVAILVAGLVAIQTASTIAQRSNPVVANKLAPWDGTALAYLQSRQYMAEMAQQVANQQAAAQAAAEAAAEPPMPGRPVEPAPTQQASAERLADPQAYASKARQAYVQQPLSPDALALVGASLPVEAQARFWPLAARISRRDMLLQTFLLQYHAQERAVDALLANLNQVLLVRPSRGPTIYGYMSQALRDPTSVEAFAGLLGTDPPWGEEFIQAAARDELALDNLVQIRSQLPEGTIDRETDISLVSALANAGKYHGALALYRGLKTPEAEEPSAWTSDIAPFDWIFVTELGFRARVDSATDALEYNIDRGKGGTLARKVVPVQGGVLHVRGSYTQAELDFGDPLTLSATCAGTDIVFGSTEFAAGQILLDAPIPVDGCDFVLLALSGRAWSDGEPISGTVSALEISFTDS